MSRTREFPNLQKIRRTWLPLALLLALVIPATTLAQERAQVFILPPSGTLVTGQPVSVDVVAEGVSNLYGAEIHLRFDPAIVRLEDADARQEGIQLTPGTLLDPAHGFVVANRSDNQAGTAVFAVTLVNPAPPVEGSGVIARLTFVPLQPGALQFGLESAKLVTRDLQTLDVALSGFEVQVSGQPIASTNPSQQVGGVAASTPLMAAPPATGVPIWVLVLVALAVVSIPLAGAWFIFVREAKRPPWPNNTR